MTQDTCTKCGNVVQIDCATCAKEWKCPKCGTMNTVDDTYGDDLGCIPLESEEATKPLGTYIASGGDILDLICGLVTNPPGPGIAIVPWDATKPIPDNVIGIQIDQDAVDYIQKSNAGRGILLREASAGQWMTLEEWQAKYQTNGLALLARMRLNWNKTGGGVQVHKPSGRKYGLDAYKLPGTGQSRTDLGSGRKPVQLGDARNR